MMENIVDRKGMVSLMEILARCNNINEGFKSNCVVYDTNALGSYMERPECMV